MYPSVRNSAEDDLIRYVEVDNQAQGVILSSAQSTVSGVSPVGGKVVSPYRRCASSSFP